MDEHQTLERRPTVGGASIVIQFLSLYLLVLAFFILLITISTPEEVKSRAVKDSLTSTFASILPPRTALETFTSKEGEVLAKPEFLETVNGLFATALGVEKVEIVQPGRLMRVLISADSLFVPGKTKIRESRFPLIDQLIAALSGGPPGFHFEMEFVIGSELTAGGELPMAQDPQMARAGAFARELLARGAPPESISIGLRPGDPDQVALRFYVRTERDIRFLYQRLRETDGPETNGG